MKKVNYKKIFMLIFFIIIIFILFKDPVLADTGFDTDFDIGSSSNSSIIIVILTYILLCFTRVFSFNAGLFEIMIVFLSILLPSFLVFIILKNIS